jgi:hypothetical protein
MTTRCVTAISGVGILTTAMTACAQHDAAGATAAASSVTHARSAHRCATTALTITLGQGSGAAGHFYMPVTFTNADTTACTITGYPGISYVSGAGGEQIGDAAVRSPATAPTVTLQPWQRATATVDQVDVANFPAADCQPVDAAGLRVFPPNNTTPVFLPKTASHLGMLRGRRYY